ncbi:MAG: hypothetical protein JJU10_10695 [Idiomarina sp.]|nr:hypothetical protein [Idiomarina sp.]
MFGLDVLPSWLEWIEPWLPWLALTGFVTFTASLVLIPILVVKMPADYFSSHKRPRRWTRSRRLYYVARNILAFFLLLAGIAMLILPGQGLLTILIAVMVSDVPGKYRLQRWLIAQPGVFKSLNWIRKRYDAEPLERPRKRVK